MKMTTHVYFLLGCVLLFAVDGIQGVVDLTVTRNPGKDICLRVICTRDAALGGGSSEPKQITLYEVPQTGPKLRLVSLAQKQQNIFIDPSRVEDINGTGTVTAYKAELNLSFRNPSDCLYSNFECEVQSVNAQGKVQIERRSLASSDQNVDVDCTCDSIKAQFSSLRYRSDGARGKLSGLSLAHNNLQEDLDVNRNDSKRIEQDIALVAHNNEVQNELIKSLQQKGVELDNDLDVLRRNESRLGQSINELTRQDQALNEDVALLRKSDNTIGKQIYEAKRSDKLQRDAINALSYKDVVAREDMAQIGQTFTYFSDAINDIENDTNAIKVEIDEQNQNDESRRNRIKSLRDRDVEIQQDLNRRVQADHDAAQQLGTLTDIHEDIENDVAVLNQNDAAIGRDLSSLDQSNTQQREEIVAIKQAHEAYTRDIDAIRASDEAINAQSVDLNNNDTSMSRQLDALEELYGVNEDRLSTLGNRVTVRELSITDKRISDRVIGDQVDRQIVRTEALEKEVVTLREQSLEVGTQIERLIAQIAALQRFMNASEFTTVTETRTDLILSSCAKGVVSDKKRAQFLLYGTHPALCDTATDGGGWIIIQRRSKGDVDFYRNWSEYKNGFGNPSTDYWLGLDTMRNLTSQGYTEARVDITFERKDFYAHYSNFKVAGEGAYYKLTISGYSGTAGDDLTYHNGMAFSTFDRDNDQSPDNCSEKRGGAFWYNACYRANPNGRFNKDGPDGVIWKSLSEIKSVSLIEIKVRLAKESKG